MSDIKRVEGVAPETTVELRSGRAPVERNFNQPFLAPGDYLAGLVASALIWGPLAAGGLFS